MALLKLVPTPPLPPSSRPSFSLIPIASTSSTALVSGGRLLFIVSYYCEHTLFFGEREKFYFKIIYQDIFFSPRHVPFSAYNNDVFDIFARDY